MSAENSTIMLRHLRKTHPGGRGVLNPHTKLRKKGPMVPWAKCLKMTPRIRISLKWIRMKIWPALICPEANRHITIWRLRQHQRFFYLFFSRLSFVCFVASNLNSTFLLLLFSLQLWINVMYKIVWHHTYNKRNFQRDEATARGSMNQNE